MFTRAQTDAIEKLLYKHAHRTTIGGAHYVTHQEFDNLLKELEDMTDGESKGTHTRICRDPERPHGRVGRSHR